MVNLSWLWPWKSHPKTKGTSEVLAKVELLLPQLEETINSRKDTLRNYQLLLGEVHSLDYYCQVEDLEALLKHLSRLNLLLQSNQSLNRYLLARKINLASLIEEIGLLNFAELIQSQQKSLLNYFLTVERSVEKIKSSVGNPRIINKINFFLKLLAAFQSKLFKVNSLPDQINLFRRLKQLADSLQAFNNQIKDEEALNSPRIKMITYWNLIIGMLSEDLEKGYKVVHPQAVIVHAEKEGIKSVNIS